MRTTNWTKWGDNVVAVSADWKRADCPVEGDIRGRQVSHFNHSPYKALKAAVVDCAHADGMDEETIDFEVDNVMSYAILEDHYVKEYHE